MGPRLYTGIYVGVGPNTPTFHGHFRLRWVQTVGKPYSTGLETHVGVRGRDGVVSARFTRPAR